MEGEFGGGGRTRTYDLRIMSCPPGTDSKEIQQDDSAERGKTLQDPQLQRNKESVEQHGASKTELKGKS